MCSRVRLSPHSPRSKRLGCLYFVFMVGTLSYVLLGTLLGCHSLAVRRMVDFVSTEAGIGLHRSLFERTLGREVSVEGLACQAGHH